MKIERFKLFPVPKNPYYFWINFFWTEKSMLKSYIEDTQSVEETKEERLLKVDRIKPAAITLNIDHKAISKKEPDVTNILFCRKFFVPYIVAHELTHALVHSWRYFSKYSPEEIFIKDGKKYNENNCYDAEEEFATILGYCVNECLRTVNNKILKGKVKLCLN